MMATPSSCEFPPIQTLLPQAGPMALLERVLSHTSEQTVCECTIRPSNLFLNPQQHVPVWIGIEYMAQSVAAHASLLLRGADSTALPQRGFLVGARQIHFFTDGFALGQRIAIRVKPVAGVLSFLAFDCEIRDAASCDLLVAGQIHLFVERSANSTIPNNTKERIDHA